MRSSLFLAAVITSLIASCGGKAEPSNATDAGGGGAGAGGGGSSGAGGAAGAAGSGAASWASCDGPGECAALALGCCGVCGVPQLSDVTGVNTAMQADYQKDQCPGGPVPCPGCASQPNPNLAARCGAGTCTAFDVTHDALSACTTDSDCRLRFGLDCCEGCTSSSVVAVSNAGESAIAQQMCGLTGGMCPNCAPPPPPGATPVCAGGHCLVAYVNGGGPPPP